MIDYSFCNIVLIKFPYTNFSVISKRPALVIYDSGDSDIVVARITSQHYAMKSDYRVVNWKDSGLLNESYVRLGKIATIEKVNIARLLGSLADAEKIDVKAILRAMFGL